MTFLPIVAREMRSAARRSGTYWIRSGAALALILVGTWIFLMMRNDSPRTIATILFSLLTGAAVMYSLLAGVSATADCLSQEKREGTLGLLFLTDLKGYDVVLGKLAANSINAVYGLLAIVPMLAIPLLIGGVTPAEFWRAALVAVNTLFFSLAAGLSVSSLCRSAQKAASFTLAALLFIAAGLPLLGFLLAAFQKANQTSLLFLVPSPGFGFYLVFDLQYRIQPESFWYSLLTLHLLGWGALALASFVAPRSWQDKPPGAKSMRWRDRWQLWSDGDPRVRHAFRTRLLEQNPFFWLASRPRMKPALVWSFLGTAACAWVWGLAKFRKEGWLNETVYVFTALVLNFCLRCWFATEAPRRLAEDRRAGTLELMLTTPLTVQEILRGQRFALERQFLGPVLLVLAVETLFMFASLSEVISGGERAYWVCLWGAGMMMFAADLVTLYWIGMWQSLTAKNPARATGNSLALVMIIPWIVIALGMLFMALGPFSTGLGMDPGWIALGLWFVAGIGLDGVLTLRARRRLLSGFRLAAQQRYESSAGWRKLFLGAGAPDQAAVSPSPAPGN